MGCWGRRAGPGAGAGRARVAAPGAANCWGAMAGAACVTPATVTGEAVVVPPAPGGPTRRIW